MTNIKSVTSKGQPVTDEVIETLAAEAEAGHDVRAIPVRLDPQLEQALRDRADADHSNATEVRSEALRAWLRTA